MTSGFVIVIVSKHLIGGDGLFKFENAASCVLDPCRRDPSPCTHL